MLTISSPAVSDAATLARLKAETFSEAFADANAPEELAAHVARCFAPDLIAGELADERCDTWWVLDADTPVGYIKVNRGSAQTVSDLADGLEVEQVYISGSHQGRGLGGRLLDLAEQTARAHGLGYVWLGVWEHNTNACSLYRRRGFRVFGEHVFMFGSEAQRDLLMRAELRSQ
jgi:diamine N-acetyltransferase